MEVGDTGMSMAGICLMPPQATIAAVQHQPFPLQCSLPASLHDPPHVQVLTDRADPLRASQAAATCVAGTVGIVEDENPAAATCVAGTVGVVGAAATCVVNLHSLVPAISHFPSLGRYFVLQFTLTPSPSQVIQL